MSRLSAFLKIWMFCTCGYMHKLDGEGCVAAAVTVLLSEPDGVSRDLGQVQISRHWEPNLS